MRIALGFVLGVFSVAATAGEPFDLEGMTVVDVPQGKVVVQGQCGPAFVIWNGAARQGAGLSTAIDFDYDQWFLIRFGSGVEVSAPTFNDYTGLNVGDAPSVGDWTYLSCATAGGKPVVVHKTVCAGTGGCYPEIYTAFDAHTGKVLTKFKDGCNEACLNAAID